MQLIGQTKNLEIINTWKDMPSFLIIQGDSHMGKTFLTLYLCKKFKLYYREIKPTVKEVRSLISIMEPNSNTVYHFKNFETASAEAKNALLKITEEPIQGNYIVITGGPQIKTLESRARRIVMSPYSESEMVNFMEEYYPDMEIRKKLFHAGINSPAKVLYYKKYDKIEPLVNYAHDLSEKITYITPEMIIELLRRFENRYDEIDAVLLFLNMLIYILEYKIKYKRYYAYTNIIRILMNGKKTIIRQPTVKRKMVLYKIFYEVYISRKE